jgi:hypothetical protein
MRSRLPLLGLTIGLAGLCLFRAAPAQASSTQVTTAFTNTIINPCNGEFVDISGISHTVVNITFSASGNFILGVHQSDHNVTGVGETTGSTYSGSTTFQSQSFEGVAPTTMTAVGDVVLISKGSAPSFIEHLLEVYTVNADGTVTVNISTSSTTCQ